MLTFDEYSEKYPCIKIERQGGVLKMTTYTRGDTIQWAYDDTNLYPGIYYHLGEAFHDISSNVENKVVIWTSAGNAFFGPRPSGANAPPRTARGWERSNWKDRHMQESLLDIDVPIICAVNGPALKHADLIFLCDIVLAADHATFMDGHMLQHRARRRRPCRLPSVDGTHARPVFPADQRGHFRRAAGRKTTAGAAPCAHFSGPGTKTPHARYAGLWSGA